ncbi:MAG: hypothetical protein QGI68_14590 [Pseudomonadales bacterium]|nr:hypothetical protein [Pseudomonadales bacterium]MDP7596774.1 hypothetical protein [Pseudomonadales bacterium]HJN51606.1 hypothetical protein [Pseudomonadales bacterium]
MLRQFCTSIALLLLAAVPVYGADAPLPDAPKPAATDAATPEPAATPGQPATPGQEDSVEDPYAGLTARGRYNLGVSHLTDDRVDEAADAFLVARDSAGPDQELRYRAAFNLGLALASRADQQADDPGQAIETLRDSAAWFNDAIRLSAIDDDDPRINLEIVLRRIQQLADQLNDASGLEKRLTRIIDDQRGVRDEIRRLLAEIESEDAGSEPVGFHRRFEALADRERMLLAEASSIAELADEERQNIDDQDAESLSDEQRLSAYQLQSMGRFLELARQTLADSRRRLRRLEGERAHRGADRSLAELKRAREQLDDPITVLRAVARDQLSVLEHTAAMTLIGSGRIALDSAEGTELKAPAWLTAEHLTERQENAAKRTDEARLRLEARTQRPEATRNPPQEEPATARLRQAAAEAIPLLSIAREAMRGAINALPEEGWSVAAEQQGRALEALSRAIERFAGLRDLIELAYADQSRMVTSLTPGEDSTVGGASTDDMTEWGRQTVADNLERMNRLEPLLREELLSAPTGEQSDSEQDDKAQKEQQYEFAETLRGQTMEALRAMDRSLSSEGGDTLADATQALEHLEALRRLFFSVVEHLRQLLAEQTRTHDDTASTLDASMEELPAELGLVAERQAGHAGMGDAIATALAEQADAAAQSEDQTDQSPGNGIDLAQVVEEVRSASGLMQSASITLTNAAHNARRMSPVLEPTLNEQQGAMEHIEAAIALMQPPDQQPQQNQPGDEQQQQQKQQSGEQEQEEMSKRQALRRLQAIRDRDAERQRNRQAAAARDPVEKDW